MVKSDLLGHGIGGPLDLPIPVTYFALAAAMVIMAGFAVLSVVWAQPRLQDRPVTAVLGWRPPQRFLEAIGVTGLIVTVLAGFTALVSGADVIGTRNIAPLLLWAVFWAAVPLLAVLMGNVYALINPWRTLAARLGVGRREQASIVGRVGLWPAAALLVLFSWFELIYPDSSTPGAVAVAAAIYTALLLAMMGWWGRDTALTTVDFFTPLNRLASAISPWGLNAEGRLVRRGWCRALPMLPAWPGLAAFLVVMLGTVSFDGLIYSAWWESQTAPWAESMAVRTALMLATVGLIGVIYGGFSALAARWSSFQEPSQVASRYAHTLVPLAFSFFFAHYFTLVIFEGQQLISALSDPFGLGWDLFGTRNYKINFFLAPTAIWLLQVTGLLLGSVATLILGHDRTLADFGPRPGVRVRVAHLTLTLLLGAAGLFVVAG